MGEVLSVAWLCQKNFNNTCVPEETDVTALHNDFYHFTSSSVCQVTVRLLAGECLPGLGVPSLLGTSEV